VSHRQPRTKYAYAIGEQEYYRQSIVGVPCNQVRTIMVSHALKRLTIEISIRVSCGVLIGGIRGNLRNILVLFTTIVFRTMVGRGAHLFGSYSRCMLGEWFDGLDHHGGNLSEKLVGCDRVKLQMKFMA
jgi:hypothetical protein